MIAKLLVYSQPPLSKTRLQLHKHECEIKRNDKNCSALVSHHFLAEHNFNLLVLKFQIMNPILKRELS